MIKINKDPSPRDIFLFSFLWFPIFGAVVSMLSWYLLTFKFGFNGSDALNIAWTFWAGFVILIVLFGFQPSYGKNFMVGLMYLGFPIGFVFSHLIMFLVWYLIFSPIGLFLRLTGKDIIDKSIDTEADSYWKKRDGSRALKDYFRQF